MVVINGGFTLPMAVRIVKNLQPTYTDRVQTRQYKAAAPWFGPLDASLVKAPPGWKVHSVKSSDNEFVTVIVRKGKRFQEWFVAQTVEGHEPSILRREWLEPKRPRRLVRRFLLWGVGFAASAAIGWLWLLVTT